MSLFAQTPNSSLPTGRYRHYKGNEYELVGLARHSETEEWMVIYRCLYGEYGLWVRSKSEFEQSVELGGESVPRFAYLGPIESAGEAVEVDAKKAKSDSD